MRQALLFPPRSWCLISLISALLIPNLLHAQNVAFRTSNLPIVVIETDGSPIPDEPKGPAFLGVIRGEGPRNSIDDPYTDYQGPVAIELRGNTSLGYDQKQYLFELRDDYDEETNASIMGLPTEHDWILYAPFVDKSLLRNVLVYQITRDIGWYASRTRFCELVLDGVYQGVYVLMENIKRDKNRVNISKMDPETRSGDEVTGGYIIAIDQNGKSTQLGFPGAFDSLGYYVYMHVYPTSNNLNWHQRWYIQDFIAAFESKMREPDFSNPFDGYASYLDVPSFVDYMLINEWANNVDGFVASLYLHKDRKSTGGKLVAGPVWDFNFAFGNVNYSEAERTTGWRTHYGRVPFWWRRLLQDPSFVYCIERRWEELRAGPLSIAHIEHVIDSLVMQVGEAQTRHFARWDLLGKEIWPNYFVGETWESELSYLKRWIRDRVAWMDANISSIGIPETTTGIEGNGAEPGPAVFGISAYPVPSTGSVTLHCRLPGAGHAEIVIRDMLGREVVRRTVDAGQAEMHPVQVDMSCLPKGCYSATMLSDDALRATAKIILVE